MYKRIVRLPIEREVFNKSILLDKIIILVYKLLLFKKNAKIAIKRAQEKMRQDYSM